MIKLKDVREGSVVIVRGGFGNGPAVKARVEAVERDIKNGMPGIDYTVMSNGDEHWAYIDQVDRVVTY
jgi:hypothetical protein